MNSRNGTSSKNRSQNNSKNSNADRYLVAEQPGKVLFLSGLLISVILGITISSVFSPGRITQKLREASQQIHKDVRVDFTTAEMSFRNGIFPRWAIVVKEVRLQSELLCWGAPVLTVDELTLPISFSGLIQSAAIVPEVYANKVHLRFTDDFKNCDSAEASAVSDNKNSTKPFAGLVRLEPLEPSPAQKNDVEALHMTQLQITSDKNSSVQTEFLNVKAIVKSVSPRAVQVSARTHLLKNSQVGDYLSHANISLEYEESPAPKIQSHVFGNWREGHYSVIANYALDEERLSVEADLRHIPLSQILEVAKKYQLTNANLEARQIWISGQTQFASTLQALRTSPLEVRSLKLEGELGDVAVQNFKINTFAPFTHDPIDLSIQNLDVARLLKFLKRPASSPIFAELGAFSGRGRFVSADEVELIGEHKGLEFVFSNRGQSEVQKLSRVTGEVHLKNKQWHFKVDRADPLEGVLLGNLNVVADRDFKNVKISTRIEELLLAPKVQRLMTSGGDVGPLNFAAEATVNDGSLRTLQGEMQISQMNVEGLFALKNRFNFRMIPEGFAFQYANQKMVLDPQSPALALLHDVVKVAGVDPSKSLEIQQFKGDFKLTNPRDFSWSKTQGNLQNAGSFVTTGGWNPTGQLRGQLQVQQSKRLRSWRIQGTRDLPILSPLAAEKNNSKAVSKSAESVVQ